MTKKTGSKLWLNILCSQFALTFLTSPPAISDTQTFIGETVTGTWTFVDKLFPIKPDSIEVPCLLHTLVNHMLFSLILL